MLTVRRLASSDSSHRLANGTRFRAFPGQISSTVSTLPHSIVVGVDPGNVQSAFVAWDGVRVVAKGTIPNASMFDVLSRDWGKDPHLFIENVHAMGMIVGQTIFDTQFWAGRFYEAWVGRRARVYRRDIKMHWLGSMKGKDADIRAAIINRFGPPGTKKDPGMTRGLVADQWSAMAIAVYGADITRRTPFPTRRVAV